MWVCKPTHSGLTTGWWEVGYYLPDGTWMKIFERVSSLKAIRLVHYLNGGNDKEVER
jgi:hypothetical protein